MNIYACRRCKCSTNCVGTFIFQLGRNSDGDLIWEIIDGNFDGQVFIEYPNCILLERETDAVTPNEDFLYKDGDLLSTTYLWDWFKV